jgi:hypothetical protein
VPVECFYIRFGNFPNYLWFSKTTRELGGEIGRLVSLRGQDAAVDERLQRQLALRESRLAELFGSQVIADVALIGRDLYLADGAAMGILFQARNSAALEADLRRKRAAALEAEQAQGAQLSELTILGRPVSLLETPDHRLRSFYVIDGDFHLVTTSRAVVERFLAAGEGRGALADSSEFQRARAARPLERNDTLFAFFSSAFFRGLLSPQYQVELRRRLRAAAAIDIVHLARLAAAAEGAAADTLDDLQVQGFLPAGLDRLADGSGPILEEQQIYDSLRGARGTFRPIPDVSLRAITASEAAEVQETLQYFATQWRYFDPLLVTVRRTPLEDETREQVEIEANVSPLAEEQYGWILSVLGPPSTHWIAPAPGDVVSIQAMLRGGSLSGTIGAHHLFLGVQDIAPTTDLRPSGLLQTIQLLRSTPGYLGAWPQLGFLDWLPLGLAGQPDAAGFSRLPLGVWRWQGDGFSVLSFQPQVLESVVPHLRPEPTDNAAQIRVQVSDLAQSQLAGWVNTLSYYRSRQASIGNARLLHMLSQQYHVPRDEALDTAQRLLQAKLTCALGGAYELQREQGLPIWVSTAWSGPDEEPYQAPLLRWFRGLRVDLTKQGDRLTMYAVAELQRDPAGVRFELPLLNLFDRE